MHLQLENRLSGAAGIRTSPANTPNSPAYNGAPPDFVTPAIGLAVVLTVTVAVAIALGVSTFGESEHVVCAGAPLHVSVTD